MSSAVMASVAVDSFGLAPRAMSGSEASGRASGV